MAIAFKLSVIGVVTAAVVSLAFAHAAPAQTTQTQQSQGGHMGGGTQPGPGTHGHSSSPKAGETKELQGQQHNMPATPSHSGGPAAGKSNQ